MGKNKNNKQSLNGTAVNNPNNQAPQFIERVVGFAISAPKEWPEAKQKLYKAVERSLLENPRFRNLSVMPPGHLLTLFRLEPVNGAAVPA